MTNKQLTVMLDRQTHSYARQFASQQTTVQKGKQVYLNTLAVCAVNNYLKCFSIPTNLVQSDCWHPGTRAIFNVADLILPNFGKLECLWVLPQQETVTIPTEAREDRLGYLVVQFEEELQQVELLGLISSKTINFATESFNIKQLQPLDSLFDTLDSLQKQINLRQWLSGVFTPDWQPVETLMAGRMVRSLTNKDSAISRAKAISCQEEKIILVLKITESASDAIDLCLQLYTDGENHHLPSSLSVKVLNATGETCLSATAKDSDDWIQLEFSCQPTENFSIELNFAGISFETVYF